MSDWHAGSRDDMERFRDQGPSLMEQRRELEGEQGDAPATDEPMDTRDRTVVYGGGCGSGCMMWRTETIVLRHYQRIPEALVYTCQLCNRRYNLKRTSVLCTEPEKIEEVGTRG